MQKEGVAKSSKKGGGLETLSKPPRTCETPICAHKLICPTTVFSFPVGTGQDRLPIYFALESGKITVVYSSYKRYCFYEF